VKWVNPKWPPTMQNTISEFWDMHRQVKRGRVSDSLENMEKTFQFLHEKEKLHLDLRNAQDELKRVVEENRVTLGLKVKAGQAVLDARVELEQLAIQICTKR
jgi:hypothetical protein